MQIKRIQWDFDAWEDCCQWQQTNKAVLKRINILVKDMRRSPFEGIGKPEPLKDNLSGFWSRRINELVHLYTLEGASHDTEFNSLSEDTKKELKEFSDFLKK